MRGQSAHVYRTAVAKVVGAKYVRLYGPDQSCKLFPRAESVRPAPPLMSEKRPCVPGLPCAHIHSEYNHDNSPSLGQDAMSNTSSLEPPDVLQGEADGAFTFGSK